MLFRANFINYSSSQYFPKRWRITSPITGSNEKPDEREEPIEGLPPNSEPPKRPSNPDRKRHVYLLVLNSDPNSRNRPPPESRSQLDYSVNLPSLSTDLRISDSLINYGTCSPYLLVATSIIKRTIEKKMNDRSKTMMMIALRMNMSLSCGSCCCCSFLGVIRLNGVKDGISCNEKLVTSDGSLLCTFLVVLLVEKN